MGVQLATPVLLLSLNIAIGGKGHVAKMVLNPLRKKRTREEFMQFKEENDMLKKDKYGFLSSVKRMKLEVEQSEAVIMGLEHENSKLGGMVSDADSLI